MTLSKVTILRYTWIYTITMQHDNNEMQKVRDNSLQNVQVYD